MLISVILGHPNPRSFNHALADETLQVLRQNGHTVVFHDLYAEGFDPLLSAEETGRDAKLPDAVALHCREIVQADGIVIIHPNWWGQPPAIVKGWVDRVLRPDVAYRFVENDAGEGVPVGLLKAKTALVFNTSNTPPERERSVFGDPLDNLWRNCIFRFCGVDTVCRETFSVIVTSSAIQRKEWLGRARALAAECFVRQGQRQGERAVQATQAQGG